MRLPRPTRWTTHTHTHTHTKHAVGRVRTNRNGCGTLYSLSLSLLNKQELKQNCEKKNKIRFFTLFFLVFFCAHLAGQGRRWQVATRGGGGGGPTLPHQASSTTAPELLFRHAGCAGCVSTSPAMRNSGRHTHTHKKSAKKNNEKQIKRNVSSSRLAIDPPSFYSFLFCFFLFVFGLLAEAGMRRKWAGIAAAVPSVAGVFFFFVIVVLFSCKREIFNSKGVSVLFFFTLFFIGP